MSPRLLLSLAGVLTILGAGACLYWKGRHEGAARERPKIETALAQAAVASLEAKGARESAKRSDSAARQREAAAETVNTITAKALKSEDANAPLERDRALRLRAADEQLCRAAPTLGGCPAGGDAG